MRKLLTKKVINCRDNEGGVGGGGVGDGSEDDEQSDSDYEAEGDDMT